MHSLLCGTAKIKQIYKYLSTVRYVKQFILKLFCEYNSNGYDYVGKMNSLKVDIISFNMQYYKYYYHQYHTKIINYDYIFAHNI